ncbi:MAG: hypothetical protein P1S60_18490 [Anaerolineae bacterium]|nr:hypothetical protein [Anaerolineae bacterium]
MNRTAKLLATAVTVIVLLILVAVFIAKEGSMIIFVIRLIVGLALITLLMSAILGGIPWLMSEKCPNCKSLNTFSKIEEIIDDRSHTVYKKCRKCGYTKPYK